MCYNIVAKFKCINKYKQARDNRLKFKYITKYMTAL